MRRACGAGLLALAGCGGGSDGGLLAGSGNGVSVTTLSAAPVRYSRTTTVTVQGAGLDKGITLDGGSDCLNVSTLIGGTDAQQNFTCTLSTLGAITLRVRDSGGKQLATLGLNVPTPQVSVTSSKGTFVIELDVANAKAAVDNFLGYVNVGTFYVGTLFNRVDAGVSIVAGGFTNNSGVPVAKTNATAAIDLPQGNGLLNLAGTVAMLRDPPGGTTVRSLFRVNLQDNPQFDAATDGTPGSYVFGKVVTGLDVATAIGAVAVDSNFNVPLTPLTITAISQTK